MQAALRFAALAIVALLPVPLSAHVTLDTAQAPALAYVRLAIRVPHGCEGSATIGLRVQVPDGVTAVKPMVKPGWTITMDRADGASASGHGSAPPVREVAWRGGRLPDEFYDEFVLQVRMPDQPGQTIWFPFVQECEGGKVSRWIERPTAGQSLDQVRMPAYPVRVLPRN
ncbi:MAG: YcnI family protein [Acetobacteraceae bacterium]